jgi:hypothetical protein
MIQIIVIVLALVEGKHSFCCCRIPLLVFRSGDLSLQPEHHPEVGAFDYISQEVAFTLTAVVLHFKHVDNMYRHFDKNLILHVHIFEMYLSKHKCL